MKIKFGVTFALVVVAALNSGCSPQQVAQFEHDLEQSQQNTYNMQRVCAQEADRYWNVYAGNSKSEYPKSIGSGLYEVRVTAPNHSGLCTVTAAGAFRGIMNESGGGYGSQPAGYQGGSSSAPAPVGADYDRGCADAKVGSYDRSRHSQAYEDGWNACKR